MARKIVRNSKGSRKTIKTYQEGGTPFQRVLRDYPDVVPSDTLTGYNVTDPRDINPFVPIKSHQALQNAAEETYGPTSMDEIESTDEEKAARLWDRSLYKKQQW